MKYFLKELVSRPIKLPSGHGVDFQEVGSDMGVIATDNGYLKQELSNAAERRTGGVVEISKEQYDELKKNAVLGTRSAPRLRHVVETLLRAQEQAEPSQSPDQQARSEGDAAAGANQPSPVIQQGEPMELPPTIPAPTPAAKVKEVEDDEAVAKMQAEKASEKRKEKVKSDFIEKMKKEGETATK